MNVRIRHRIWIEVGGQSVIGPGGYDILAAIDRTGSISRAARELGMSYRFVWNYIDKMEQRLGVSVVKGWRGGSRRGGAQLTPAGRRLLEIYGEILDDVNRLTPVWEEAVRELLEEGGAGQG